MGLLDRLRSWFGSGADTDERSEAENQDDANESSDPAGLDPDNVTEVRTEGSDDAAEKLRELSDREEEPPDE